MADTEIVSEKLNQAQKTLQQHDIDVWATFARETSEVAEPSLPLILDEEFVWPGMVLIPQTGKPVVICELHDGDTIRNVGLHEVRTYDNSFKSVFHDVIVEFDPDEIAINYSKSNNTADGLSYGLYRLLKDYVESAPVDVSLISGEKVVSRVRGNKSETELQRIQKSVNISLEILDEMRQDWQPDWSEARIAEYIHEQVASRGLSTAWHASACPAVDAGSKAEWGHAKPSGLTLPKGEVLHIDFGVVYEGYASDMQRLYYRPVERDTSVPHELQSAFEDVRTAINAGIDALKPGVKGFEVDKAARDSIINSGWPEYQHGLGHQVGRNVHDGGTYLGPKWERYGDTPKMTVQEGEVFTIELGIETEWGYLGQEEMVQVTADGAKYLTEPQSELYVLS